VASRDGVEVVDVLRHARCAAVAAISRHDGRVRSLVCKYHS
jgi:hypothetical protein